MGVNVVYEWSKQQIHIFKNTFYLVEKPKIGSFLIINVKSAKNLKNADLFGTSDPYFICKFTDGWSDNQKNRLFRGSCIHNNLNPEWNAKICVELKEAIGDELKFEFLIFDYDHRLKIGKILVITGTRGLSILSEHFISEKTETKNVTNSKTYLEVIVIIR